MPEPPNMSKTVSRQRVRQRADDGTTKPSSAQYPVTAAYLRRAALHYLSQRAASRQMLADTLERRARRRLATRELPADVVELITTTLDALAAERLLDDRAYAATRLATLGHRGLSRRRIAAGLAEKGLDRETIAAAVADAAVDDLAQARRFAERRRLGPWSTRPDTEDRRRKDLAALGRAGFSYDIARRALASDTPE